MELQKNCVKCLPKGEMDLMAHEIPLSCFFHRALVVAILCLYLPKCGKQDRSCSFPCCCLSLTPLPYQGHVIKRRMKKTHLLMLSTLIVVEENT